MDVLRTPDERFRDLPDYPFASYYTQIPDGAGGALRVHHVDEGPRDGHTVLLMHGEPSWSYLYRKMIMVLVDAGYRALAPDLVGFGRSDKPTEMSDYSYRRHVDWMESWFEQIGVADVTLFCQDWGGLIGLRMVTERPDRFRRIAAANTGLPTGDAPPGEAFVRWQEFSQSVETFPVGPIVNGGCVTDLPAEVIAAYDAPFPDETYKAGARILPALVPTHPDDPAAPRNRAAWEKLRRWEKPFLTLFSDSDPITAGVDAVLRDRIPGAEGQPHVTIEGAGHFLQEDRGEEVARHLVDWMRRLDA